MAFETGPSGGPTSGDRYAATYRAWADLPTDVAHYGPDIGTEADYRLCGDVKGKRVLELGCGGAHCSIAFAKHGATTIGVDASAEQLSFARRLCEQEGVRVELHHGDLADLAFVRADTIDLVFSAYAFSGVEDLGRVFRQVHRVLKRAGSLVFSLPHPAWRMIDMEADGDSVLVRRAYFDRTPIEWDEQGAHFVVYPHTVADLFSALTRTNFRVDNILEPEPDPTAPRSPYWHPATHLVPRTLIMRSRKEGM